MKLKIAKGELDFAQKPALNKDFWQNDKLNPEVRAAIIAVVNSFLESTNLDIKAKNIDEIEFTGSLANYNHNKFSDVDIHLLFDFSKLGSDPDFMRDYLTAKAINWNNKHKVMLFGHEVELYITAAGTDHHSTGVYSVKNDEWLVKPVRDPKLSAELNLNKVKDKADKISKEIDMLVIKQELPLEKLEALKDKIKKMRVTGLETGGEYSTENLAFKLLRRRGELSSLYTLMTQARDEELSLDEDMEWWKKRRSLDNKNYRELMGYVGGKGVFKRKYAAKNIGYPKSVSRKKLSKLGAPYMMDPPSKLPKSGPPGVGALEEENNLNEDKIPDSLKNAFDKIKNATMKFQVLKDAKGKAFGIAAVGFVPGKTYTATITGDNIKFPKTEKFAMTKTKAEFLNDLETENQGQFCDILNCKTSTITTGSKTQTFRKFIAALAGPQKPSQPVTPQKKKSIKSDVRDAGIKQILGSGPVPEDVIRRILDNVVLSRMPGDKVKIYFRDIYMNIAGQRQPCLKKHSYTANLEQDDKTYKVVFDGKDWNELKHPKNTTIDPAACRFFNSYQNNLKAVGFYNWLGGQMKQGTIYRIELMPKDKAARSPITYVGSEYVPPVTASPVTVDKKVEGPFFRKVDSIKNKKNMLLFLHPKKTIFAITDIRRLFSERTINYVYYTPRSEAYEALLLKNNKTELDRETPGKQKLVKFLKDQLGQLDVGPIQGVALDRLLDAVVRRVSGDKTITTFKRDEYLKDLKNATDGRFCEFFDCKKSKIQFRKAKPISIEKWLRGAKGKTEEQLYTIFIKKLNKDFPKKDYKPEQIKLAIDENTRGVVKLENGAIVRSGVAKAIKTAGRVEKADLKIESGAEQPEKTIATWKKFIQDKYYTECYELNPLDADSHIGQKNVIKKNIFDDLKDKAARRGIRIPKFNRNLIIDIPCKDAVSKQIVFTPEQLIGDIFNTGLAIKVDDKTNAWLSKNGNKIGFAKVPNVKNGWFMDNKIQQRWDGFSGPEGASAEVEPGEVVAVTVIKDPKLKKFLEDEKKITPGNGSTRIKDNLKSNPSSNLVDLGNDRKIDRGFYNALLWMKDQMKNDGVKDWEKFEVGGGQFSGLRTDEQTAKNFQNNLNNPNTKSQSYKRRIRVCNGEMKATEAGQALRQSVAPGKGVIRYTIKCPSGTKKANQNITFSLRGDGSPHRTGRAADFAPFDIRMVARKAGMQKPIFKWLETNAPKFGFIPYVQRLRNKKIPFGEIVEPWHWEMSPANAEEWAKFGPPTT